ncbi:lytic murein transglycosylase B [Niveibacterium terrae]|uniref:lytic murein transglycosylase B n=1 Tax=Niveibacterium terrae TaxID=3373598 RepID=UPI003A8DE991
MDIRTLGALSALLLISPAAPAEETSATPYAERTDVRAFAHELAKREGLDEAKILASLCEARFQPSVIKAILPPASPASRSWVRYRARFLDRPRITGGLGFWQIYSDALTRAEKQYGVPAEIIVAIIGIESIYGRGPGNYQTLSALATLAFDYPPRAELFRQELSELFLLARDQSRDVASFKGSYAGAIGLPQFMPSSIRRFAIDFDADGKIDLEMNPVDAIGSVANFLNKHGWKNGEIAALPARVSDAQNAAAAIEGGIVPRYSRTELARLGISADTPLTVDAPAALIDLPSPEAATEYWLGYANFYVITRYNRSSFYAMSVLQLARALRTEHDQQP